MKIESTTTSLKEALMHIRSATTVRSTLPVLSHVLIQANDTTITFFSTDLDVGIWWTMPGEVKEKGAVAVSAKRLLQWVSYLPEGKVSLKLKDGFTLDVSSGKARVKFNGINPKEFPTVPIIEGEPLRLGYDLLQRGIDCTAFAAASASEPRMVLTGVLFERDEKKMRLVATNAHRLALWEVDEGGQSFQVIVPSRSMTEAIRVLDSERDVEVYVQSKLVAFHQEGRTVFARPLDGKFPPYEQVVPAEFDVEWRIAKEDFQLALRRASVVVKEESGGVKIKGSKDKLCVQAIMKDVGEAEEEIEISEGNGEGTVAFNVEYVLDVFPHLKGDYVWLRLNNTDKPALVQGEEENYRYIIMPMRLS